MLHPSRFLLLLLLTPLGCDSSDATPSSNAPMDAGSDAPLDAPAEAPEASPEAALNDASPPLHHARVFEVDPVSTPDLVDVGFPWLGEDGDGTLTAAEDEDGVRRIRVYSC